MVAGLGLSSLPRQERRELFLILVSLPSSEGTKLPEMIQVRSCLYAHAKTRKLIETSSMEEEQASNYCCKTYVLPSIGIFLESYFEFLVWTIEVPKSIFVGKPCS